MRGLCGWIGMAMLAWAGQAMAQPDAVDASRVTPQSSRPVAHILDKSDVDAWLDGYMPYALQRGDAAGAVVVVVKDGKILTKRGFGYADVATRRPVDPDMTLFRQASISKLITWTAVMQMVERGKIDLDRDVNAYLDFKIPDRFGKPVTMRNLMTHRGGFEEVQRGLNSYDIKDVPPLDIALKRQIPIRIFPPGTTPAYSNYGTTLAAYIVQRVSGEPFDAYAQRHIFTPAGMVRSSLSQRLPIDLQSLVANGYGRGSGKPTRLELNSFWPAGGMSASGVDMGRFMIAHLDHGGVLLRPETARHMHDTILKAIPPLNGMALGFYEQNINGRRALSHAGDTLTFHSQLWLLPDDNVGIYMSMNAAGTDKVSGPIRSYLFDAFADRYFPFDQKDGRVDAATAKAHARMMVGTYNKTRRLENSFLKAMELSSQIKVGLDAQGGLLVKAAPGLAGQPRTWIEIAPFVWRDSMSKTRLAAQVENGKVVRFGLDSSSPYLLFEPAPWYLSSAWLTPALLISLVTLFLTALSWPIVALVRRRYGVQPMLTIAQWRAYRSTRCFAGLAIALLVCWLWFSSVLLGDFSSMNGELDWALIALQVATPLVLTGLFGAALWNAGLTWRRGGGRFAKGWSLVLIVNAVILLWIAIGFHLIGFSVNF
ncbi:beta-lactamase family protein [Sphingobium sp. 3R8]|uniref:serine hydrolase domain-containing protein n=1 Tax=Sphingobium sp. 3R8 TaxID=2874921 RepID=UPI001CCD5CB9|nr:serine hydrolase domain-containing protein [Sphingobium sp. 3R8]MBZ9646720.1 beta-lactamase family protein [Sphingobium sp. 3R8]